MALPIAQSLLAAPLRVAADPVPYVEILDQIQKIDSALHLTTIELNGGINAGELLAAGASYF